MVDFFEYDASSTKRHVISMHGLGVNQRGRRTGGFSGNTLEDVVDKRVQNRHSLVRDTRIRVDLLKDWNGVLGLDQNCIK